MKPNEWRVRKALAVLLLYDRELYEACRVVLLAREPKPPPPPAGAEDPGRVAA